MPKKVRISDPQVFQPASPYSLGIKSTGGRILYISGQVALDCNGHLVGKENIEAQTRQVFFNLINLLKSENASLKHVVKMTSFLVDQVHVQTFMLVRREFLKEEDIYPANTLLIVKGLAYPDWLVEIEAVAVV